jgi:hypothetical protein
MLYLSCLGVFCLTRTMDRHSWRKLEKVHTHTAATLLTLTVD